MIIILNNNLIKLSSSGVISSIIGQYISDVILNIIYDRNEDFIEIITLVSPVPLYYASTISGFISGSISQNVDVLTNACFRNVIYVYFNNYFSKKMNEEDIVDDIDLTELIQDTIAIVILLYTLDEYSRNSFNEFKKNKKEGIKNSSSKRPIESAVIITFITNAYAFYKLRKEDTNPTDRSIDL